MRALHPMHLWLNFYAPVKTNVKRFATGKFKMPRHQILLCFAIEVRKIGQCGIARKNTALLLNTATKTTTATIMTTLSVDIFCEKKH